MNSRGFLSRRNSFYKSDIEAISEGTATLLNEAKGALDGITESIDRLSSALL
jgi:hypothetical protein